MPRMPPVHPGEILFNEFMRPNGISISRLSLETSIPMDRLQSIISGNSDISEETAAHLAAYFSNSAKFWINCQNSYNEDINEQTKNDIQDGYGNMQFKQGTAVR